MQLVTDRAADISPEQLADIDIEIHYIPLTLSLEGKTYVSGVDIQPAEFYELLENSEDMPTTSLASPGEIEQLYRDIAEKTGDKEILSVHISSGLSGTPNAARLAIEQVKQDGINVHLIDTKTLGPAEGWQVEAAARGIMAGWSLEQIQDLLEKISAATNTVFTLPTLKYLIHGGRISHIKGLLASTLGIKPLIGVNHDTGKYEQRGQVRTFKRAVPAIADNIAKIHPAGTKMVIQPVHALNPPALQKMIEALDKKFDAAFRPQMPIAPVLGAHTGSGLVGCAFARADELPEMP